MDLYAFRYQGDTILVRSTTERAAVCRAFHEVCESYELDPDRLERLGWPADDDFFELDLDEPAIIEGGS